MGVPSSGELIEVYRLPDFDLVATPEAHHDIAYMLEKNGPGSGEFTIPIDDPAYALIQMYDLAAIRRGGNTVATIVIERIEEHTLDTQGGAKQVATYMGGLQGAMLGWALIAPALGDRAKPIEDDAVFDWRSPRYTPSGWSSATEVMTVEDAEAGAWPHQPMADRFDLTTGAMMICDGSGDDTYADAWWRLFYRDITITTPGRYAIEMLMDDHGMFWVDGIQMYEVPFTDGFVTASFKRIYLSAGVHHFCWAVFNFEDPDNPGDGLGPSALAYNLYKVDLQDQRLSGGDSWISDSNTKVHYTGEDEADWPGMNQGRIWDALLDENWNRGDDVSGFGPGYWIGPTFNSVVDSDGESWDAPPGITTKTGTTSYLQFLDELVAAGRIARWRMRPDCDTFDMFAPGYTSRPGDVELEIISVTDPNTGEVYTLDRVVTAGMNADLVRWKDGWRWVSDVDDGGLMIEFCQGHAGDSAEVVHKAQAELSTYKDGQTEITVGVAPGSLDGLIEGDEVFVDGAWREIAAISASLDDSTGIWTDAPQFGVLLDEPVGRIARTLRAIGGLNQGTSHIARPVASIQPPNVRP